MIVKVLNNYEKYLKIGEYNMVIQYLEKIQRGFGERLLELKKEEEMIQKSLNENQRFIELLEESTDTNIAAFSPRKNNPNEKNRIEQLKDKQLLLSEKVTVIQNGMKELKEQYLEVSQVIEEAKKYIPE